MTRRIKAGDPISRVDPEDVTVDALEAVPWVKVNGEQFLAPPVILVYWETETIECELQIALNPGERPVCENVSVRAPGGMTTDKMRIVPITSLIHIGISKIVKGDPYRLWRTDQPARYSGVRMSDELLRHVCSLADVANGLGGDVAQAIADVYEIPVTSAHRWDKLAHERTID